MTPEQFDQFKADEDGAIDQLRVFVGRALGDRLDRSLPSLEFLDRFVQNLVADPEWMKSALFRDVSDNVRTWLAVRVAYYLAACLRDVYDVECDLSEDHDSPVIGTPVLSIEGVEISPLEIASAYLDGAVVGGLQGLVKDLQNEIHTTTH